MIGRNRREQKNRKKAATEKTDGDWGPVVPDGAISDNDSQDGTSRLQQQQRQQKQFSILSPQQKKKQAGSAAAKEPPTSTTESNKSSTSTTFASNRKKPPGSSTSKGGSVDINAVGEDPIAPKKRQHRHTSGPASTPLYPSLDAVDGLSVRVIYPKIDDDDDKNSHRLIGSSKTKNSHNNSNKPWTPLVGLAQTTRAASDAVVPSPSLLGSRDRSRSDDRSHNQAVLSLSNLPTPTVSGPLRNRNIGNAAATQQRKSPPHGGGGGDHPRTVSDGDANHGFYGRPSNRGASLEDDTPGPTQEQQRPTASNTSVSTSTSVSGPQQGNWHQMAAAVAAATSAFPSATSSMGGTGGDGGTGGPADAVRAHSHNPNNNHRTPMSVIGQPSIGGSTIVSAASSISIQNSHHRFPPSQGKEEEVVDEEGESSTDDDDDDQGHSDSEDSELRRALLESSKIAEQTNNSGQREERNSARAATAAGAGASADDSAGGSDEWSQDRRECTRSNATTLRTVCGQDKVELEVLDFCLHQCEQDQATLSEIIERRVVGALDEAPSKELQDLLQLNETLLSVIEMAKEKKKEKYPLQQQQQEQRQEQHQQYPQTSCGSDEEEEDDSSTDTSVLQKTTLTEVSSSMEVRTLVEKQDIFTLICMLRSQILDERLDAALALLKFARGNTHATRKEDKDSNRKDSRSLCDEIHSSGGLHSLLSLFLRSNASSVKLVSALAVAHILPASVIAMATTAPHNIIKPQVGLKIMECLRFLSTVRKTMQHIRDETITARECWKAATMGLATFWIHALEPMLRTTPPEASDGSGLNGDGEERDVSNLADLGALEATPTTLVPRAISTASGSVLSGGRQRYNRANAWGAINQRRIHTAAGIQEILEMAVALVIRFATKGSTSMEVDSGDIILLVEQVCGMEAARPIAVREGILRVLVEWIRTAETEDGGNFRMQATAVLSLRRLTSIKDKYMAGWIHSQMISSGALPVILALTRDIHLSFPVRLAICQILASLCIAPHTRAAVVEADCINFLIDLLSSFDYNSTTGANDELALFAGQALLQLVAGAVQRAGSVENGTDNELLGFASRERHERILKYVPQLGKGPRQLR